MKKGSTPRRYVIFGYASIGKAMYDFLLKNEPDSDIVFCDNSSEKRKEHLESHTVLSLADGVKLYPDAYFIITSLYHRVQMEKELSVLGVRKEKIISKLPSEIVDAFWAEESIRRVKRRDNLRFEVNINKHCNLNCKGCDHFAPLSVEDCMDLNMYTNDMRRLASIFDGKAWQIHLLGGEPLLNPDLLQYMRIARECFPDAEIWIDTNGILLKDMPQIFWKKCQRWKIGIMPTRYPIKIDYDELRNMAIERGIAYQYLGSSESGRLLWHFPLDLSGSQDARDSFLHCRNANQCLTLESGRLYTCSIAPNIKAFNRYYGKNIHLTEEDGIDIYKAISADKLLDAMAQPMPFCRYCNVNERTYDHPWEVSKKTIDEWT